MKKLIFLVLIMAPVYLHPQENDAPNSAKTKTELNSQETIKHSLLSTPTTRLGLYFDPGMTMRSGSETMLSLHYGLTRLEEHYRPLEGRVIALGPQQGRLGLGLPVQRQLQLGITPQSDLALLVQGSGTRQSQVHLNRLTLLVNPPFEAGPGSHQALVGDIDHGRGFERDTV